jgi:hypothetical protein
MTLERGPERAAQPSVGGAGDRLPRSGRIIAPGIDVVKMQVLALFHDSQTVLWRGVFPSYFRHLSYPGLNLQALSA